MEKSRVEYKWNIIPSAAPLYWYRCSKCKKNSKFYCSDKFRINAQKKRVDIWLIYKCVKCDSTFNIDILSRVDPKCIDEKDYFQFQNNNKDVAWKFAYDLDVIKKNKIRVDYSEIEYEMLGDILSLEDIVRKSEEWIEFGLNFEYSLDLKLVHVIRKNLNLSLSKMEKLLSAGAIAVYPTGTIKKMKVSRDQKVILNTVKLKKYLKDILEE